MVVPLSHIIIIIIIIIISFMQDIYTYIPETNYVPREYGVAAILLLLFMVLISLVPVLNLLYFYISTFWSMFISILCLTRDFIRQGHAREKRKVYRATRTRSQAIDRG